MNIEQKNIIEQDFPFHPTFLGWITQWLGLILFPTIILYVFSYFFFPLSKQGLSFLQALLLQFLGTIPSILFCLPVLIGTLPFKPIDFSMKGIYRSLLHIFIFILSLPILAGFLLIYYVIYDNFIGFANSQISIIAFSCFLFIPCFSWFFFALFLVEEIVGKNSSETLTRIRYVNQKHKMIKNQSNNGTLKNRSEYFRYSKRWITITFCLPFLLIYSVFLLNSPSDVFLIEFIGVFSIDLMFFLLTVPMYRQFFKSHKQTLNIINASYNKVFGSNDISNKIFGFELLCVALEFTILPFAYGTSFPTILLFYFSYLFVIFTFFLTIWSNQVKKTYHMLFK